VAWLIKIGWCFLGFLYALLALILALIFIPVLAAVVVGLLSVCVFNKDIYKIATMWSFNKTVTLITYWVGKAAECFRNAENVT